MNSPQTDRDGENKTASVLEREGERCSFPENNLPPNAAAAIKS